MPLDLPKLRRLVAADARSKTQIAAAAGLAQPNLARLLAGGGNPTISTLERLAKALRCRPADLVR